MAKESVHRQSSSRATRVRQIILVKVVIGDGISLEVFGIRNVVNAFRCCEMLAKTIPVVEGWPYVSIAEAHAEFCRCHGKLPSVLWVGIGLWMRLRRASDAEDFVTNEIPIHLDRSGILEENEYMFSI